MYRWRARARSLHVHKHGTASFGQEPVSLFFSLLPLADFRRPFVSHPFDALHFVCAAFRIIFSPNRLVANYSSPCGARAALLVSRGVVAEKLIAIISRYLGDGQNAQKVVG